MIADAWREDGEGECGEPVDDRRLAPQHGIGGCRVDVAEGEERRGREAEAQNAWERRGEHLEDGEVSEGEDAPAAEPQHAIDGVREDRVAVGGEAEGLSRGREKGAVAVGDAEKVF